MALIHTGRRFPRRQPDHPFHCWSTLQNSPESPFYQLLTLCAQPLCIHTRNHTLRQKLTLGTPWIHPRKDGFLVIPGPNTKPGRPECPIPDKVDKAREKTEFHCFYDFRTLLSLFVDSLGVLSGFWTRITHLFLNYSCSEPLSGRLKVVFPEDSGRLKNRPIRRQE